MAVNRQDSSLGEWVYQELKDWKIIESLDAIAEQQSIQSATASAHLKASEKHAKNVEKLEKERLSIEKAKEARIHLQQKMRGVFFSIRENINKVNVDTTMDPVCRFIIVSDMNKLANSLPVKECGDYQDMEFHSDISGRIQSSIDALREIAHGQILTYEKCVVYSENISKAADALDAIWQSKERESLSRLSNSINDINSKIEEQGISCGCTFVVFLGMYFGLPVGVVGLLTRSGIMALIGIGAFVMGVLIIIWSRKQQERYSKESKIDQLLSEKCALEERLTSTLEHQCRDYFNGFGLYQPYILPNSTEIKDKDVNITDIIDNLNNLRQTLNQERWISIQHLACADQVRALEVKSVESFLKGIFPNGGVS